MSTSASFLHTGFPVEPSRTFSGIIRVLSLDRRRGRLFGLLVLCVTPLFLLGNPSTDGLQVWLKSDAGIVESEGVLESWTDQSSNGILFQPPGAGPAYVAEPDLNDTPVVRFSGAEQLNASLPDVVWTEGTIFTVLRYNSADSSNEYLYTFGVTGSGRQWTASRRSNQRAYYYDGSSAHLSGNGAIPSNRFLIFSQTYGGSGPRSHEWRVDEQMVLSAEASGDFLVDAENIVLGNWSSGNYRFVGDIAELLVYDRPLEGSERLEVEEYLLERHGLVGYSVSTPEDFSSWEVVQYEVNAQADANWVVSSDGQSVGQTVNADPSIFLSQAIFSRGTVEGEIGAGTASDFMGFVFGYQDRGHFYVFDWKKTGASWKDFGFAGPGMRLRSFHVDGGEDPTGGDFWSSADPAHVTVLESNDVPWEAGKIYSYQLVFRPGLIEIEIRDGETVVEEWSVADGRYTGGRFGYYINSLQDVSYGRLSFTPDSETPLRIVETRSEDGYLRLSWEGGVPPYLLEESADLSSGGWTVRGSDLSARSVLLPTPYDRRFYRVSDSPDVTPP